MKRLFACILLIATLFSLTACPAPDNGSGGTTGTTTGTSPATGTTTGSGGGGNQPETVSFSADFTVAGADADLLTAALEKAGIAAGDSGAAKTVAVGEGTLSVSTAAKTLANGREANYGDFALVCDGTNLAVYGASAYATELAVAYLLENYASGTSITVPKNLSYAYQPTLATSTIAGRPLKDFTVVYSEDRMAGDAADLARGLSVLCGYEIPTSSARARVAITLRATGTASTALNPAYTVACASSPTVNLTITGANIPSTAAAARHFLTYLPETSFADGDTMDKSFTTKKIAGNNTDMIKYCGTWQATVENDPETMVSYWNGAYAEIEFTGHSITVEFSNDSYYMYRMDKGEYSTATTDKGSITFHAEEPGESHVLRIYSNSRDRRMYIKSFSIPEFESFSRPAAKKHYVQFVGDSISDSQSSYSYQVGDVLDWDFSVTAYSGMALQTGRGFWKNVNPGLYDQIGINVGMEDAFFRLGHPTTADYYDDKWKINYTSGNTPDIVFIFLGTNDELYYHLPGYDQSFIDHYESFVGDILETYGESTKICCLQALTTSNFSKDDRYQIVRRAAANLVDVYGSDTISFIDRDQIETWNIEISSDGTHPTVAGYGQLTEYISAYLERVYG